MAAMKGHKDYSEPPGCLLVYFHITQIVYSRRVLKETDKCQALKILINKHSYF